MVMEEEDEEDSEVEEIEVGTEVPTIKHKVPKLGNSVQWNTSPHKEITVRLTIGILLKLSVIPVMGLDTIKMVVLFEVMDKTLAEGATARP